QARLEAIACRIHRHPYFLEVEEAPCRREIGFEERLLRYEAQQRRVECPAGLVEIGLVGTADHGCEPRLHPCGLLNINTDPDQLARAPNKRDAQPTRMADRPDKAFGPSRNPVGVRGQGCRDAAEARERLACESATRREF